ncbi:MAG: accessory factor UbiK family protein [Halothiobacillaceae bacterium]|jgi:BMFP domain-containing protein YqiC|nr:accessory factor UbiK family protein [Halothiobacillaceae bacterium]MDY0050480.1 accessory factor UbiK family protein [Halothiobacillaceae bacterium]
MSLPGSIDEIARRIEEALPEGLREVRDDMHRTVRTAVQGAFQKMELVTREEFDVQTQVLARTRARLEALETRVAELEARLNPQGN